MKVLLRIWKHRSGDFLFFAYFVFWTILRWIFNMFHVTHFGGEFFSRMVFAMDYTIICLYTSCNRLDGASPPWQSSELPRASPHKGRAPCESLGRALRSRGFRGESSEKLVGSFIPRLSLLVTYALAHITELSVCAAKPKPAKIG